MGGRNCRTLQCSGLERRRHLKAMMSKDAVTMFEMTGQLGKYLVAPETRLTE